MSKMILFTCLMLCCMSIVACRGHQRFQRIPRRQTELSYSPELLQDMREFMNLIPQVIIDELIGKHIVFDSDFRKAINYLRSGSFKQLVQRAELLPEVIEVINFAHLNDSQISRSYTVQERVNSIFTDRSQKAYGYQFASAYVNNGVMEDLVIVLMAPNNHESIQQPNLSSFISFTEELLTHLPRDRFVALINEKRRTGNVFPKFYEAIRSPEFEQLVDATMKSENVVSIMKTLASNAIDAQSLKRIAFEVISWGPSV